MQLRIVTMKSRPSIDEIPGPEKIVRNTELAWDDLGFQSLSRARAPFLVFYVEGSLERSGVKIRALI